MAGSLLLASLGVLVRDSGLCRASIPHVGLNCWSTLMLNPPSYTASWSGVRLVAAPGAERRC